MSAHDDTVFLTGGTGFIGGHVLRALLAAGYRVRALVRGEGDRLPALDGCVPVHGDLERPGPLARELAGCRYLVHVASLYSFAPRDRARAWTTNVAGCRGLLEAARVAGVERAVVTSSSSTVGPAVGGRPATEDDHVAHLDGLSAYHASKVAEEREALAARVPVVLVLPTAPVGPGDWKPTPTGRMVLDFLRGRMFASVAGGLNLVAVEDVARAHVLALERGRVGERYLVGGENLTFAQIWGLLAGLTGRPAPRMQIPHTLALSLAWADEARCRALGSQPAIPLEGARMARHYMYVGDEKARRELAHRPAPVGDALGRAVDWYRAHGYAA
ncbi:MAG TPA: NAD-dependent epimerase/dehydratase family protein [Thermomicrobiales bacterium]|nr:NAD-dependent epimerase/dehydratase family protein [Thermomicrobiales bacterium]